VKKILVTGANGFIGKSVTKKLLQNHSVDVYCRNLKKNDPSFVIENHINHDILLSSFKDISYDYVINCIACSDTSSKNWSNLYEANCKTTMTLINNLSFKNFIQFSSFSIFSKNSIVSAQPDPKNLYGLSKLISEKLLEIHASKERNFIILRMPLVIGASKIQNDIINYFYKALISSRTVDLYNEGKYLRNIIHVNDVVGYLDKMLSNSLINKEYSIINLNSANTLSMNEICVYMRAKLKSKSKINYINKPNIENFDSLLLPNAQKTDGYSFKDCKESIDCYIEEMKNDLN
jgi:nucleoside-diphosphate-sugar epimerase